MFCGKSCFLSLCNGFLRGTLGFCLRFVGSTLRVDNCLFGIHLSLLCLKLRLFHCALGKLKLLLEIFGFHALSVLRNYAATRKNEIQRIDFIHGLIHFTTCLVVRGLHFFNPLLGILKLIVVLHLVLDFLFCRRCLQLVERSLILLELLVERHLIY